MNLNDKSKCLNLEIKMNIKSRQMEWIKKKNQKQTNLWILHNGQTYKLKHFMKNIIVYKHQNPGTHWNIVPPAGPLLLWAMKRGGPKGKGCHWLVWGQLSWGWWTGKVSSGCLAATEWTSLTNEGSCPVHWGKLSTSWPDGKWNKF